MTHVLPMVGGLTVSSGSLVGWVDSRSLRVDGLMERSEEDMMGRDKMRRVAHILISHQASFYLARS